MLMPANAFATGVVTPNIKMEPNTGGEGYQKELYSIRYRVLPVFVFREASVLSTKLQSDYLLTVNSTGQEEEGESRCLVVVATDTLQVDSSLTLPREQSSSEVIGNYERYRTKLFGRGS